jgi:hypothetical protein
MCKTLGVKVCTAHALPVAALHTCAHPHA